MSAHSSDGDDIRRVLDRIQAGDEDAARELLRRYEPEVRLVVRRQLPRLLRSRFDSLDFLQSVWGSFFHQVRQGTAQFEDSHHLIAFLASVARNKVVDEFRHSGSHRRDVRREVSLWEPGSDQPRDLPSESATPSQLAEARDALEQLRHLVPESRRPILDLKADGLSSREIGDRLGLSERTVQRVLEDLRRRLDELRPAAG
ncbi:MAG: hypothetical protein KatS3mg108_3865 [Isosphaeraceae bacterium]|jgi:RNA polymerase sigma-70 factor (ECF subfamily)|nr:MAG: hypothetical protein KatS3mg108_3865 [Isosphaeraceae bacterium]